MPSFSQLVSFSALLALANAAARLPLSSRDSTPNFIPRSAAALPGRALLQPRACGETAALVCYGVNGAGTAQDLDPDDISYAAAYLRYLADEAGDPLWTMPPEFDCSEWTLPLAYAGTVMATVKHINPRTNSSVTYYDLANTIDGGVDATDAQVAASLLGQCGKNGGSVAVTANANDPAYLTPGYIASGAKPADVILKLVRDPASL